MKNHSTNSDALSVDGPKLKQLLLNGGYQKSRLTNPPTEDSLIYGKLSFNNQMGGLQLHFCDLNEKANGSNSVNLSSSLTFNIMLSGNVSFQLNKQRYDITCPPQQAYCFTTVIPDNTVFTRHFVKDNHIKKLSITLSREWIIERCSCDQDRRFIDQLFCHEPQVIALTMNNNTVNKAMDLSHCLNKQNEHSNFNQNLTAEFLAIDIVGELIQNLMQKDLSHSSEVLPIHHLKATLSHCPIKELLDQDVENTKSIKALASQLGLSSSTLQRRFKHAHGITVRDYIQQQKLELAKQRILFDQITIGEAAFHAGFNHASNFITAFKRQFGMTPAMLKKQYLQQ